MSSEKTTPNHGFRIKWGDKEIEYFGDSSKDLFMTVFDYIKSIPSYSPDAGQKGPSGQPPSGAPTSTVSNAELEGYKRIAVDAGVTTDQVQKVIIFEKRPEFPDLVPMMVSHPKDRDAVKLAAYAMQVGLQKNLIELATFKKILCGPNNYQFPGGTLGGILKDFRKCNYVSASATQGRYKPFNLTKEGLDLARDLIRKA
jgi:hypothetical protein